MVHNISRSGMLIETSVALEGGEQVHVDLPHESGVAAEVVWTSGQLHGCRFLRPISPAALSAVQLKADAPIAPDIGRSQTRRSRASGFGKLLEQSRKARGMTLEQVAHRLGVSKPTVWAWEKGKARPLEDRYPAIAETLGLAVEDLRAAEQPADATRVVETSREQIARALGVDVKNIRILIEL